MNARIRRINKLEEAINIRARVTAWMSSLSDKQWLAFLCHVWPFFRDHGLMPDHPINPFSSRSAAISYKPAMEGFEAGHTYAEWRRGRSPAEIMNIELRFCERAEEWRVAKGVREFDAN